MVNASLDLAGPLVNTDMEDEHLTQDDLADWASQQCAI
jgi:hypothetical protein